MSKRSHRRHRPHHQKHDTRQLVPASGQANNSAQGTSKRRYKIPLVVVGLVVIVAAVLLAVNGGKGPQTAAPPSTTPAPAQSLLTTAPGAVPAAGVSGPKISFASSVHDFGQIKGTEVVKCTFMFTNVGNQVLEVTNVQASCGCTTAGDWSRKVEPGKTGTIPIQFNGANFSGQVAKSITVTCNDPTQPTVGLQITANIWKPIQVTPQYAVLNVTAEAQSNATTVRIVSNEQEPLTLSAPENSNPAFAVELKTNQPGKEFELTVRTVPPLPPGNRQGQITLKTSSTNMPVINVNAWANVQPMVAVMPSQISLPAAPLTNPMPYTLTLRNNSTNALALSEPMVTAPGVDVQLKEIETGRVFSATLTFPVGFELAPGKLAEFNIKSSHADLPVVKVPILSLPSPAPQATGPGQAVATQH